MKKGRRYEGKEEEQEVGEDEVEEEEKEKDEDEKKKKMWCLNERGFNDSKAVIGGLDPVTHKYPYSLLVGSL